MSQMTAMYLLFGLAFFWGAVWGSFLNVVIYRLPMDMSLVKPGSRCGVCETPIRWYDNIPCISYLILRGRCRACDASYSPRYMLVELACGLMTLALFKIIFIPIDPALLLRCLATWLWLQVFIYALVVITFIDLEHFFIPDEITLPAIALGIGGAYALPNIDGQTSLYGALSGAGFMLLIYGFGWLVFRREAMGLGDVKLMGLIGAFLGWMPLAFVVFASAVQAIAAVLITRIYTRLTGKEDHFTMSTETLDEHFGEEDRYDESARSHTVIPYGPFLAIAALECLFFQGGDVMMRLSATLAHALFG